MEACLEEDLPLTTELEEGLRNGVYLGKLANFFAPKMVSEKRIYDRDQSRYKVRLCFIPFEIILFINKVKNLLHLNFSPAYIIADRKTFHIFQTLPDSLRPFHTGKGRNVAGECWGPTLTCRCCPWTISYRNVWMRFLTWLSAWFYFTFVIF